MPKSPALFTRSQVSLGLVALALAGGLVACAAEDADDADMGAADGAATVGFRDLADGAEVESPLNVCLDASGVVVEPAGDGTVTEGHGHHHILVDAPADEISAIMAGTSTVAMAKDETHVHIGDGTDCAELTLAPGSHQLTAVVADGAHVPLSPAVTSQVNILVK